MTNDWKTYHQQTKNRNPSPLLAEALRYVKDKQSALDLGAGALVESKFLLAQGFKEVVAVDITPFEPIDDPRFIFITAKFEEYEFRTDAFDLVNAQFALPFTSPESFNDVWGKMRRSLVIDGVFSGQLFGKNDEWSTDSGMTFHTREDVEQLLKGMEVLELTEVENEGRVSTGESKHWHLFRVIARRI